VLLNNGSYFEQSTVFDTWTRIGIILLALFFAIVFICPWAGGDCGNRNRPSKMARPSNENYSNDFDLLLIWAVINLLEAQQETYLLR
jgi:hypothetical protein